MPRFKTADFGRTMMVPIVFSDQIMPGTFEHTLCEVIDSMDLSIFHSRFCNDETGAPAYDPGILLRIILYAYSRGIYTSRRIERCCVENVLFMAMSADSHPDHSTIASFVSSMEREIVHVFRSVLEICIHLDLIDGAMFAIDGCKLSGNASKEWSGTKSDLRKKRRKLVSAIEYMVKRHKERDRGGECDDGDRAAHNARIAKARKKVRKLDRWLAGHEDKQGYRGRLRQSNVTDNESAKMKTSHGVIQGYNGIAVVDSKHQIVVHAQAHGSADDAKLLDSAIQGAQANLGLVADKQQPLHGSVLLADTAFHSIDNCAMLQERGIEGYVPDSNFRKRDPRFSTAGRHDPARRTKAGRFDVQDFSYDAATDAYTCPMGYPLEFYQECTQHSGMYKGKRYIAKHTECLRCRQWRRCLKGSRPHRRSLMIISGTRNHPSDPAGHMRARVDTPQGREMYSKRMGIVEPVFGNTRWAKRLDRLTLRGEKKASIQFMIHMIVHNIEKAARALAPLPA